MDPVQLQNGEIVAFKKSVENNGFTWFEAIIGTPDIALRGFGYVLGEVFPAKDGTFTLYTEALNEADDDMRGDYEVQDVTVEMLPDAVRAWFKELCLPDEEETVVVDDRDDEVEYVDGLDPYDKEYDLP